MSDSEIRLEWAKPGYGGGITPKKIAPPPQNLFAPQKYYRNVTTFVFSPNFFLFFHLFPFSSLFFTFIIPSSRVGGQLPLKIWGGGHVSPLPPPPEYAPDESPCLIKATIIYIQNINSDFYDQRVKE